MASGDIETISQSTLKKAKTLQNQKTNKPKYPAFGKHSTKSISPSYLDFKTTDTSDSKDTVHPSSTSRRISKHPRAI